MIDPKALPARIHLPQVLELAGYGRVTLWRRQKRGQMPGAVDRGPFGGIYDRDAVLKALGIGQNEMHNPADAWNFDINAYREAEARAVRRPKAQGGRQQPGVLRGPAAPAPLRLASSNPAPANRRADG